MINDGRHANAAAHAKVMKDLRQRSSHEIFETAVEAGIYTAGGQLTARYRTNGTLVTKKAPAKRK